MARRKDGINNRREVFQASTAVIVAVALVIGSIFGYMFYTNKELDDATPVEFESMSVESLTIEKEEDFILKLYLDVAADSEVTSVVVNGEEFTVKEITLLDSSYYQVVLNANNETGTITFQLENIHFNQDGVSEEYIVPADIKAEARILMNVTDNVPVYMGISVPDTIEKGDALPISIQFEDVEGLTEVVVNNLRFYAGTDFNVVDNATEVTINMVGFSELGTKSVTINEFKYSIDSTVVTTSLSSNNIKQFQVVVAQPELLDVTGTNTVTVAEVEAGTVEVPMYLNFTDTSMLYSITVNGSEILVTKANVLIADETTVIITLPHTDATIGTHHYVVESFKYFDSVNMNEVDLSAEIDMAYSLIVQ